MTRTHKRIYHILYSILFIRGYKNKFTFYIEEISVIKKSKYRMQKTISIK